MNIGENIQNLRKKLGLNQEELAQKIPVSRQTVSQWENGQTAPSIDNLIILKEIFGVSVDEILGEEKEEELKTAAEMSEPLPAEKYTVKHSKEDLKDFYRKNVRNYFVLPLVLHSILFAAILLLIFISTNGIVTAAFAGAIFTIILIKLIQLVTYRKAWQRSFVKYYESTYEYTLFDGYFTVGIYRHGEKIFSRKAFYSDIERTEYIGSWFTFQLGNQSFFIKKEELEENSALLTDIYNKKSGLKGKPFSTARSEIKKFVIMLILLLITSATLFVSNDYNSYDAAGVFEGLTGIELPVPISTNTIDRTDEQSALRGYVTYEDIIVFDEADATDFEKQLAENSRWMTSLPDEILGITAGLTEIYMRDTDFDYVTVYNSTENQFNKVPDKSAMYFCFNALYDIESNTLKILEYHIDYAK